MGDSQNDALRVDFDRQIKLEFHGSSVTSDAGLLAYRELDEALGLSCNAANGLHDTRSRLRRLRGWGKRGQKFIRVGNSLLWPLRRSTMGLKIRNRGPGRRLSGKDR